MKFSELWLRELVNPKIDSMALAEQLIMAGLEIESVEPVAPEFSGVVIGEIIERNPHPNADKLSVCKVNIGENEPLTIVCGAANARAGIKVPTALIGAVLPNNFKIKAAKLRGVESYGMLCSAVELGLAESSQGILELESNAPVGTSIRSYLALDDKIINLEITPNRADCLSVFGVAREVAVLNSLTVKKSQWKIFPSKGECFKVNIQAKEACPIYCGRVIRNINLQAKTPFWLVERLRRSGLRSINPVVDVSNYVMLSIGQPMHAFDLSKLCGGIMVRQATDGETLTLLDGKQLKLDPEVLVIADHSKPLAMAGIMGGLDSGVNDSTRDIFLESAYFNPKKMLGVARRFGLQTDSSYRFERGVDPELQNNAIHLATALLLEIVGGEPSEINEVKYSEFLPKVNKIILRRTTVDRILGIKLKEHEILNILQRLNMQIEVFGNDWLVKPPSYRFDINIEEDLVEEIARIYGYNTVPERSIMAALTPPSIRKSKIDTERLSYLMVALGYREAITYGFNDPKMQKLLEPNKDTLALVNPISSELSVMRTTLWNGLLQAAKYNLQRQHSRVRLFEISSCFNKNNEDIDQSPYLGAIAVGAANPEQWCAPVKDADFFDIKNDFNKIMQHIDSKENFSYMPANHNALHPRRSASILLHDQVVGYVGQLHPKIQQILELPKATYLLAVNLAMFNEFADLKFQEFSELPAIQRDIAIVIDKNVSWTTIKQKIVDISKPLLQNIEVFDVYMGENIESNKKSIAIHLIFQHLSRTLVDTEVDELIQKIISSLQKDINAVLR